MTRYPIERDPSLHTRPLYMGAGTLASKSVMVGNGRGSKKSRRLRSSCTHFEGAQSVNVEAESRLTDIVYRPGSFRRL